MFGTAGLPHILMRFYTVPDAATARVSVNYATGFIGAFYLLTFILGFGAMVIVGQGPIRAVDPGGNMAAPLLAEAVGGQAFLGFIAAVAFATILAVVAGLTLAGAAALSHDLWVNVVRTAARANTSSCGSRGSRPCSSASCRSRSASRSRARMSRTWWGSRSPSPQAPTSPRSCSRSSGGASPRAAAQLSMFAGTASSLLLIALSPAIMVDLLHQPAAIVPAEEPGDHLNPALLRGGNDHDRALAGTGIGAADTRRWPNACIWARGSDPTHPTRRSTLSRDVTPGERSHTKRRAALTTFRDGRWREAAACGCRGSAVQTAGGDADKSDSEYRGTDVRGGAWRARPSFTIVFRGYDPPSVRAALDAACHRPGSARGRPGPPSGAAG